VLDGSGVFVGVRVAVGCRVFVIVGIAVGCRFSIALHAVSRTAKIKIIFFIGTSPLISSLMISDIGN
jgi:hypothetical protein